MKRGLFFARLHNYSNILQRLVTAQKSLKEESILRDIHAYNNGNHGMQHGGCELRRMNSKLGQWHISTDARRKKLIGQRPESNNSVRKLLLLIYKCLLTWEKMVNEEYYDSHSNRTSAAHCPSRVLLRFELRPQCLENYIQSTNQTFLHERKNC